MRIAQLAPLEERVPPALYGGTELIVSLLTEQLVRRGHQVTLFASGDSITKAELVSVRQRALRADKTEPIRRWQAYDLALLLEFEKRKNDFDIVHNHLGYQALPFLERLNCPSLTTNHNELLAYCAPIYLRFKALCYVAISNAYKRLNYPNDLNYTAVVYNGIETDRYVFSKASRKYLLFLGRLCKEKGTVTAIEIAQAVGIPLKLAGKVDEADKSYFEDKVKPLLDPPNIEYIGEVNFTQKLELYSGAVATLCPIAFDEPFGLVMAESLAVGTPVVALDRGAVSEVVSDKETGIVGNTKEELISRFKEIESMSPQVCRDRVVSLFSDKHMTDGYEALYKKLASLKE